MTVGGVQMQVHKARKEVEVALAAILEVADVKNTGRRDMLVASVVKWITMSLDGLEMARKSLLEFEIEGGRKA